MPELEKLVEKMVQSKINRAVLIGDQPMRLSIAGRETSGPIIPMSQLQSVLREVMPPHLAEKLAQDEPFQFPYQSPRGIYNVAIEKKDSRLQVSVAPLSPSSSQSQVSVAPATFEAILDEIDNVTSKPPTASMFSGPQVTASTQATPKTAKEEDASIRRPEEINRRSETSYQVPVTLGKKTHSSPPQYEPVSEQPEMSLGLSIGIIAIACFFIWLSFSDGNFGLVREVGVTLFSGFFLLYGVWNLIQNLNNQ